MSEPKVKKVIIGNDHGGVDVKNEIVKLLAEKGIEVINVGTDTARIVRYPNYSRQVAGAVARG